MDTIGAIITAGVAAVTVAIIVYTAGLTTETLPKFGSSATGAVTTAYDPLWMAQRWNNTMLNLSATSQSGMSLLSITPLVVAAGVIIAILLGIFVMRR